MATQLKEVSVKGGVDDVDRSYLPFRQKRYRVAQWGTGNVGSQSLKAIIQHPQYDLVGVKVYSDAKAGKDAGDLCGMPKTGIIATKDIEEIIAAKPDCVAYMADRAEEDVLVRLLESGINIATSRMEFNYRGAMDPAFRARIEAACQRGKTSVFASGSTPGWSTEIMPIALTAMMRRLDMITLTEFADMESRNSPEMLFDLLKFGKRLDEIDVGAPHATVVSTPPSISMTADAFNLTVDEVVCSHEYALTKDRVTIAAGTLEKDTIGAMRMIITGMRDGKPVIRRITTWFVTRDVEPAWDLRDTGWHYRIEGDTPLDVMIHIPATAEEYPLISPGLTAHPVVNGIPHVCEAAPGIRHLAELPPLIPNFGRD